MTKSLMMAWVCVLMFSVTGTASAASYIETDGLTEKQKAELALKMAEMKEGTKVTAVAKASEVNNAAAEGVLKWGTISTEIAKGLVVGLAAAAKEANIAVNEFSQTPVGKITTVIIVWKMIGQDLMGLLAACLLLFVIAPSIWKIYNLVTMKNIKYEDKPVLWGLYQRRRIISFERDTTEGFSTFVMVVLMGLSVIFAIIIMA